MLLLKEEHKLNNISVSNLQSIIREKLLEHNVTFYFNGFNLAFKKFEDCDINKYYEFLKYLEEKYEIIETKEFDEEYIKYFNLETKED